MTRSVAGVERPSVCSGLDPLLLIVCYVMLKAKKKKYSFGALAAAGRHNTVYVAVGFDIKDVVF